MVGLVETGRFKSLCRFAVLIGIREKRLNKSVDRERADIVIVGGGIVGCATAYHLARRGAAVRVFECGRIAGEQSGRAWGFVRQQNRHSAEVPLAAEASRLWEDLERELQADVQFIRGGILVPAKTEQDESRLVEAARTAREHGVRSYLVTSEEMRRIVPEVQACWRAGLFSPDDGHAEPVEATRAFAEAARRLGVVIHERTPVLGIETSNDKVTGIVTAEGRCACDAVLCAAGIGSANLSRTIGVSLPVQVVRASVAQTLPTRIRMRTAVWTPQVAFRPKRDGSFYISNGYRGIDAEHDLSLSSLQNLRYFIPTFLMNRKTVQLHLGREFLADLRRRMSAIERFGCWPEPKVNLRLIRYIEEHFYEVFPYLKGLGLARTWAGRIDATPDLIPIIGTPDTPRNYYVAAGFNGHGFALGPVVGKLLAELIWDGKASLDLHSFRPSRFADGDARPQPNAL